AKTLDTLETHVRRCGHVINDLLNFARTRPVRLETVDPAAVLRNALREHVIPKSIRVVVDVGSDLTPIQGDQQLLEQAISNLVANALEAMRLLIACSSNC